MTLPKKYIIASRTELLAQFVQREGGQLAPGVDAAEWSKSNNKKLHIGDRVIIPLTDLQIQQLHQHHMNLVQRANAAPYTTKVPPQREVRQHGGPEEANETKSDADIVAGVMEGLKEYVVAVVKAEVADIRVEWREMKALMCRCVKCTNERKPRLTGT